MVKDPNLSASMEGCQSIYINFIYSVNNNLFTLMMVDHDSIPQIVTQKQFGPHKKELFRH
jgi:hypothetical protein